MKLIENIAADCMDAYNQEFFDDNEHFFDQEYFERQCEDAYASRIDKAYQTAYATLRSDNKHRTTYVELDTTMLSTEDIKIEKEEKDTGYWFAKLKGKIFSFQYDQSSCGLQHIMPKKRGECVLVRAKQNQDFLDEFMPPSKIVNYWPWKDGIRFDGGCCKDVTVMFVAAPHPKLPVQDGLAFDIKQDVLNMMFSAKRGGQPSDPSNDSSKVISDKDLSKEVK